MESAMLHHRVYTVVQNRQTKTLALETAFRSFMAPDGHRSFSYTLGRGEALGWLQSAASLRDATNS